MLALGVVFVVLAMLLILVEAHVMSGGLIGVGAALALIAGLALLLGAAGAGLLPVLAVSAGLGAASASGVLVLARSARSNRRLRPRSGTAAIVGHTGVIRLTSSGAQVYLDGGLWRAEPSPLEEENVLHDGDRVVVEHVNGLTLYVRKAEELELYP